MILNLHGNEEVINRLKIVPSNLEPCDNSVIENFEEEKKEEVKREQSLEFEYPAYNLNNLGREENNNN